MFLFLSSRRILPSLLALGLAGSLLAACSSGGNGTPSSSGVATTSVATTSVATTSVATTAIPTTSIATTAVTTSTTGSTTTK